MNDDDIALEKHVLDERIENLIVYTTSDEFPQLDLGEQSRIRIQVQVMCAYSTILEERIAAASGEVMASCGTKVWNMFAKRGGKT